MFTGVETASHTGHCTINQPTCTCSECLVN